MAIVIDTSTQYQTLDGFGVDMACIDAVVSDAIADLLWSQSAGIGITWCRLRASVVDGSIPGWGASTTNAGVVASAQKARDRGARFWALADGENTTPAGWLSAGLLASAHYADYAAGFQKIADQGTSLGLPVEYVSVFNEPDLGQSYTYVNSGTMIHDIVAQVIIGIHANSLHRFRNQFHVHVSHVIISITNMGYDGLVLHGTYSINSSRSAEIRFPHESKTSDGRLVPNSPPVVTSLFV